MSTGTGIPAIAEGDVHEHTDTVRASRQHQHGDGPGSPPVADMTAPATRAPGAARRLRLWSILGGDWFAIVTACVLVLLVGTVVLDEPERVDIEITNPTVFALSIEVTDTERDGWLPTGRLGPGATRTIQDVIDQGEVWVFRFGGQGRHGGELEVTRHDLERAAWHLVIPAAVGDRLAAQGAPPTPSATPGGGS
jgi:hypothetical protein